MNIYCINIGLCNDEVQVATSTLISWYGYKHNFTSTSFKTPEILTKLSVLKRDGTRAYKNINNNTQTIIRLFGSAERCGCSSLRGERAFFPLNGGPRLPFRRMFAGNLRDSTLKQHWTKKGEDFTAS